MLVNRRLDAPSLIGGGFVKIGFEAPRDVERGIIQASKEKLLRLIEVEPDTELSNILRTVWMT
jgi:hypothetical protein